MKFVIGNPNGILVLIIMIFSALPPVILMYYCLDKKRLKELIKLFFGFK